jgi:hypothetical protein
MRPIIAIMMADRFGVMIYLLGPTVKTRRLGPYKPRWHLAYAAFAIGYIFIHKN